ncbi:MAG: hypothetical protein AAF997_07370 [Myxococcota bacterium]
MKASMFVLVLLAVFGVGCKKDSATSAPADDTTEPTPDAAKDSEAEIQEKEMVAAQPEPPRGNLLTNPSFEEGRTGWQRKEKSPYWVSFEIEEGTSQSGTHAVELELESTEGEKLSSRVAGIFQEVTVPEFPARIGGSYYVKEFEKSDPRIEVFLQVVVIVWAKKDNFPNYQIRYYLAGQPYVTAPIGNAKIEVLGGEQPPKDTWTKFDIPVRDDFERLWGEVPKDYERVEVFFELRWDKMTPDGSVEAEVLYDDLYIEPYAAP